MIQNHDGVGDCREVGKTEIAKTSDRGSGDLVYKIGDRVLFFVIFNSPGYMKPGDKIPGTVIWAFEVLGIRIYRIKLDIQWSLDRHPQSNGENIVVGNVTAREIRPIEAVQS